MFLLYKEIRSGGEVCKGQENDAWPNFEDEYVEFLNYGIALSRPAREWGDWEEVSVTSKLPLMAGDTVYTVVARYFDGSTFGRTCGLWEYLGGFTDRQEAENLVKKIKEREKQKADKYAYPWDGYFAGLEDVELETFVVQP